MRHHLNILVGNNDDYKLTSLHAQEREITIAQDCTNRPLPIRSNMWQVLDSNHLEPCDVVTDLMRLAIAVYSADLRVLRSHAYDGWTREFVLHFPVATPSLWKNAKPTLISLLRFLTGDIWEIVFRQCKQTRPPKDKKAWKKGHALECESISLFSGGLDSFIQAVELMADGKKACLVGHYDDGVTSDTQKKLSVCIRSSNPRKNSKLLQFYIQPPVKISKEQEITKRSRSLLFLALGVLISESINGEYKLIIPENGFIGLNAPLTITRMGSLSTRTTHPYTLQLFSSLLDSLDVDTEITNPYRDLTKGEMIERVSNEEAFRNCAKTTLSCAHPHAARWLGRKPNIHCGYCVPCIIRRAAFNHLGLDPADEYALDLLSEPPTGATGHDLRAFLIGIERYQNINPVVSVLNSGPIPLVHDQFEMYIAVFKRGMNEVHEFLSKRRWKRFR